jgi:hypothetical protein
MDELELRSAFASLLPCRDSIQLARNYDSWFPVVWMLRAIDGDITVGSYKLSDGSSAKVIDI